MRTTHLFAGAGLRSELDSAFRAPVNFARNWQTGPGTGSSISREIGSLASVLPYEGTSEVHMLIMGQAITGLPAFR